MRRVERSTFTIDLHQAFAAVTGEVERGGAREALVSASVRGSELRFTSNAGGDGFQFSGTVRGHEITGVLSNPIGARTAVGRLRGSLRPAPWAQMPPDCRRYYDR